MSEASGASRGGMRRLLDPRIWFAIAVTVLAGWFAVRDVDFGEVGAAMAKAKLGWLIIPSFLAYVWTLYLRALRWKHLAAGVCEMSTSAAYRATAVGGLVNNVLPLRIGELARAWFLAREIRAPAPPLFGTIILERVFDLVVLVAVAAVVIGSQVELRILGLVAVLPMVGILALRRWPEALLGFAHGVLGAVLPSRFAERVEALLRGLADGLSGMRSPRDLAWTVFYSFLLWGVASVIPFWSAMYALGIDTGGPVESVRAAFTVMVWVAAAAAIPAAPGLFGTYQAAAKMALIPLGASVDVALATGILCHLVFWLSFIVLGLAALRGGVGQVREAIADAEAPAGATPPLA
jgi:uncharacterized protein (TIRG00374 family)